MREISDWALEARFRVGSRVLFHALDPLDASALFSDIADCTLEALAQCARDEIARSQATSATAGVAILATGQYGGRCLSLGSELEIAIYDTDNNQSSASAGRAGSEYSQRMAALLLGGLRGKPGWRQIYSCSTEGQAGCFEALQTRLIEGAWSGSVPSWPRLVCCVGNGADLVSQSMSDGLKTMRDANELRAQASASIAQLRRVSNSTDPRTTQGSLGGLAGLAILTHYLRLQHAPDNPSIRSAASVGDLLAALGESGAIPADQATALADAWRLLTRIRTLRGLLDESMQGDSVPERLRPSFAEAAGVDDFGDVAARLNGATAKVQAALLDVVGEG